MKTIKYYGVEFTLLKEQEVLDNLYLLFAKAGRGGIEVLQITRRKSRMEWEWSSFPYFEIDLIAKFAAQNEESLTLTR